jgi:hypothetical protein
MSDSLLRELDYREHDGHFRAAVPEPGFNPVAVVAERLQPD